MRVNLCDLGLHNSFLDTTPKAQVTGEKNGYYISSEFLRNLCFKGHHRENGRTTQRNWVETQKWDKMGEMEWEKNICKLYIWLETYIQNT